MPNGFLQLAWLGDSVLADIFHWHSFHAPVYFKRKSLS
jgi:hypothetical protein